MSLRSFFGVLFLAGFSLALGLFIQISSSYLFSTILLVGFLLFSLYWLLKDMGLVEIKFIIRHPNFPLVILAGLGAFYYLLKAIPTPMPSGLVFFMALNVFALIFLSAYLIFYED